MATKMTLEAAEQSLDRRSDLQKRVDAVILADVKRGMRLLREKYGEDWVEHIDPETFDMCDGSACVLGQVVPAIDVKFQDKGDFLPYHSGYAWAERAWSSEVYGDDLFDTVSFGFNSRDEDDEGIEVDENGYPVHGSTMKQLQEVWETVFELVGIKKG